MRWALGILVVGMAVGVALFWVAPLLGALVILGVVGGVGLGVGPALFEAIGRMLSGYPPWTRR